jgi:hypothetical protein
MSKLMTFFFEEADRLESKREALEEAHKMNQAKTKLPPTVSINSQGKKEVRNSGNILHCKDGPAITHPNGSVEWYKNGLRHREDGPAVILVNGDKEWFINGGRHREDGPAVEKGNGELTWYRNGQRHRVNGPAYTKPDGTNHWYLNDIAHREDGPALIFTEPGKSTTTQQWWWNGYRATEEEITTYTKNIRIINHTQNDLSNDGLQNICCNASKKAHSFTGPARKWADGTKEWFVDGIRHRADGPAIEFCSGEQLYYYEGILHTKIGYTIKTEGPYKKPMSSSTITTAIVPMPTFKEAENAAIEADKISSLGVAADKNKIKQWPEDPAAQIAYDDVYAPLKDILEKGYNLVRKTGVWSFDYNGYDLGKIDKQFNPNIKEQISEKYLKKQKEKHGISLMDIVMRIVFMLGIEQGRRVAYQEQCQVKSLQKTLANYRERNKSIQYRLAIAEAINKIRDENPTLSPDKAALLVKDALEKTRHIRIEEIKKELRMDPSLNCFKHRVKRKIKLSDLLGLANTLDPEIFHQKDWISILQEANCSESEWKTFCRKHKFNKFLG